MLTAEQLAAIAGAILSLVLSYVPGLSDWYGGLDATKKRLAMAALLFVSAAGVLGLSCADVLDLVECTTFGAVELVKIFIAALMANQAIYLISPKRAGGAS